MFNNNNIEDLIILSTTIFGCSCEAEDDQPYKITPSPKPEPITTPLVQ